MWVKVFILLGSVATAAATFGGRWIGLPERFDVLQAQVDIHQDMLENQDESLTDQSQKLDRVICLLTLPDTTSPIVSQERCP